MDSLTSRTKSEVGVVRDCKGEGHAVVAFTRSRLTASFDRPRALGFSPLYVLLGQSSGQSLQRLVEHSQLLS